jgi:hypothetical protein
MKDGGHCCPPPFVDSMFGCYGRIWIEKPGAGDGL